MVFILRPNGGHVDGFACFGVQISSALPQSTWEHCLVTINILHMISNAGMCVVINHQLETFIS